MMIGFAIRVSYLFKVSRTIRPIITNPLQTVRELVVYLIMFPMVKYVNYNNTWNDYDNFS